MKSEIEKMQELVRKAESILSQKNCLFIYDVYVKVDSGLYLNFSLRSLKSNQVICQYGYNLDYIEKKGLDYIVDEVIENSKKVVLDNIKNKGVWSPENEKIVLVLDIMGFKDMISNLPHEDVYLKLYKVFTQFSNLSNIDWEFFTDKFWVELFSDTIFIISSDCSDATVTMLNMIVSSILWQALKLGIVFKGAYAEGKVIVDRENHICFGQPIIDAYLLEEKQAWFGIACHESVKSISEDNVNVVHYIDGKEEIVQIKPIFITYNVPLKCDTEKLITEKLIAFAWFNHAVVSCDDVKKELLKLKANCPLQVKEYYDRVLDFMIFCQKQGDLWLKCGI